MKIDLTQDEIDRGNPRSYTTCPVALAMRRCLKLGTPGILVGIRPGIIGLADGGYEMPKEVADFVRAFDAGKPVKPITFEWAQP